MSFIFFNFLVANLANFIQRRKIFDYLYRDDIDKAVHNTLKSENVDKYLIFLKNMLLIREIYQILN
jgi:hypothetical protein